MRHTLPIAPQFYVTAPQPCPYLEGRQERKLFTALHGDRAQDLNDILSTINNKETLNDIKLTINAARSISSKIDDMSDDFEKLTKDKELTKSIRDLTIGLSKFLNEIYP